MTAIPMAMGFAMAMGMRPEHGIVAGALACTIGRTFGGSKYQVYGPTAAFIPVIASLMTKYGQVMVEFSKQLMVFNLGIHHCRYNLNHYGYIWLWQICQTGT